MTNPGVNMLNPETKTGKVRIAALELLENSPPGIRWVDLNRQIEEKDPTLHPKTINGTVWRLTETLPKLVYKPEKGLFRHTKFK